MGVEEEVVEEEKDIEINQYVHSDGLKYVEFDSRIYEKSLLGKNIDR